MGQTIHPENANQNVSVESTETLPATSIVLPISIHGKEYNYSGGPSDHLSEDPIYIALYEGEYAKRKIYSDPNFKPAGFDAPRPRIHGLWFDGRRGVVQLNTTWRNEADLSVEFGTRPGTYRLFPATELTGIDDESRKEIVGLLQKGYGVMSALTNRKNLVIYRDKQERRRVVEFGRQIDGQEETIVIDGKESNLWDEKRWLEDNQLVAALAGAYETILSGKLVWMIRSPSQDTKETVLVAQALSQMLATKANRLMYWISDGDALMNYKYEAKIHLNFVGPGDQGLVPRDQILIDPRRRISTSQQIVDDIRASFSKPIPEAMQEWHRRCQTHVV